MKSFQINKSNKNLILEIYFNYYYCIFMFIYVIIIIVSRQKSDFISIYLKCAKKSAFFR